MGQQELQRWRRGPLAEPDLASAPSANIAARVHSESERLSRRVPDDQDVWDSHTCRHVAGFMPRPAGLWRFNTRRCAPAPTTTIPPPSGVAPFRMRICHLTVTQSKNGLSTATSVLHGTRCSSSLSAVPLVRPYAISRLCPAKRARPGTLDGTPPREISPARRTHWARVHPAQSQQSQQ